MAMQQTLSIIKPDGVKRKLIGKIIDRLEAAGFGIEKIELKTLNKELAEGFYAEHKGKPFFGDLVNYMTSGPVVLMQLSGEDVIATYRKLMGATNPENAEADTLRKDFAVSVQENTVHGSDSPGSAQRELDYFFHG